MPKTAPAASINATILTFGYPETLIAEYDHWLVLLRPQQVTLGALVLAARSNATRFSDLPAAAFSEMHAATRDIETTLRAAFDYDKMNYLMLMMVDPHVHFHVLPRYAASRSFEGAVFSDPGWPKAPDLGHSDSLDNRVQGILRDRLRTEWRRS